MNDLSTKNIGNFRPEKSFGPWRFALSSSKIWACQNNPGCASAISTGAAQASSSLAT